MNKKRIDAFLVTKAENIFYLSGFTGGTDAQLFITLEKQYILTDARYYEQVALECPDWQLVEKKGAGWDALKDLCTGIHGLGFEAHVLTVDRFQHMQKEIPVQLIPHSHLIESLRIIKDEEELNRLRQAAAIGDRVFLQILSELKIGMSERHIANRISFLLREYGCSKESFDIIAVSGPNAALPHGQPSDRTLQSGDMLTLDMGGIYKGYAGDMTRTVSIDQASQRFRDLYMRLLEAQQIGLRSVCAGVCGQDVDAAVRKHLSQWNLDVYFVHSLGHGVGLEVHEEPRLSPYSELLLQPDMVVTVEPGIYIPAWGGIRIEDTVIVKSDGCEIMTCSDKSLLTI
ncbi:MAG TPA: aminopeptidase P family protein [Syntrophomonadaceae bacterium]|nr:aminopeptidase P family protein [Syntrophomonadaceae bacterium]